MTQRTVAQGPPEKYKIWNFGIFAHVYGSLYPELNARTYLYTRQERLLYVSDKFCLFSRHSYGDVNTQILSRRKGENRGKNRLSSKIRISVQRKLMNFVTMVESHNDRKI